MAGCRGPCRWLPLCLAAMLQDPPVEARPTEPSPTQLFAPHAIALHGLSSDREGWRWRQRRESARTMDGAHEADAAASVADPSAHRGAREETAL